MRMNTDRRDTNLLLQRQIDLHPRHITRAHRITNTIPIHPDTVVARRRPRSPTPPTRTRLVPATISSTHRHRKRRRATTRLRRRLRSISARDLPLNDPRPPVDLHLITNSRRIPGAQKQHVLDTINRHSRLRSTRPRNHTQRVQRRRRPHHSRRPIHPIHPHRHPRHRRIKPHTRNRHRRLTNVHHRKPTIHPHKNRSLRTRTTTSSNSPRHHLSVDHVNLRATRIVTLINGEFDNETFRNRPTRGRFHPSNATTSPTSTSGFT